MAACLSINILELLISAMSRTFLTLLSLSALVAYCESLDRLETNLQSTIGTLKDLYPDVMGIDPNGSRWIGYQIPEGSEEEVERLVQLILRR
jgi:hypothetical protein